MMALLSGLPAWAASQQAKRGGRTVMRLEWRRMRRKGLSSRDRASLSPAGAYAANSATKRWQASRCASRGSTRDASSDSQAASASSAAPCHACAQQCTALIATHVAPPSPGLRGSAASAQHCSCSLPHRQHLPIGRIVSQRLAGVNERLDDAAEGWLQTSCASEEAGEGGHLLLEQVQQQLEPVVGPQLSTRALRAVRHAANEADCQRPQLSALLALLVRRCLCSLQPPEGIWSWTIQKSTSWTRSPIHSHLNSGALSLTAVMLV